MYDLINVTDQSYDNLKDLKRDLKKSARKQVDFPVNTKDLKVSKNGVLRVPDIGNVRFRGRGMRNLLSNLHIPMNYASRTPDDLLTQNINTMLQHEDSDVMAKAGRQRA